MSSDQVRLRLMRLIAEVLERDSEELSRMPEGTPLLAAASASTR